MHSGEILFLKYIKFGIEGGSFFSFYGQIGPPNFGTIYGKCIIHRHRENWFCEKSRFSFPGAKNFSQIFVLSTLYRREQNTLHSIVTKYSFSNVLVTDSASKLHYASSNGKSSIVYYRNPLVFFDSLNTKSRSNQFVSFSLLSGHVWTKGAWVVPGHVYTAEAWASPRHVFTTEACAAPDRVYTTEACAAPDRVYTTEACAAPDRVYTTEAWAAPRHVYTTEACAAPDRVYTTEACVPPVLVYTAGPWAHLDMSSP